MGISTGIGLAYLLSTLVLTTYLAIIFQYLDMVFHSIDRKVDNSARNTTKYIQFSLIRLSKRFIVAKYICIRFCQQQPCHKTVFYRDHYISNKLFSTE